MLKYLTALQRWFRIVMGGEVSWRPCKNNHDSRSRRLCRYCAGTNRML